MRSFHDTSDHNVTAFDERLLQTDVKRETIAVTGMSCNGCEQNVESALRNIGGVNRVEADHEGGTVDVVVDDDVADDEIQAAIERAGYDIADN